MERIRVPGGELSGESAGSGEPVLFIHGSIMADTFDCMRSEPALGGYRLITYRRRGFVDSVSHSGPFSIEQQATDAQAVLRHYGVEHAHVVGHSYGGATVLQLTLDAPAAVHSLSLFEPAGLPVPAGEELAARAGEIYALYNAGDSRGAVVAFVELVNGGPGVWGPLDKILAAGWLEQAVADADTFFQIEFPALGVWTFGPTEASKIARPSLAVAGEESIEIMQQTTGWLEEHLSDVTTFRVPRAAHVLQLMNPAGTAEGLGAFLAAHPM